MLYFHLDINFQIYILRVWGYVTNLSVSDP